jgi:hypothetical protein
LNYATHLESFAESCAGRGAIDAIGAVLRAVVLDEVVHHGLQVGVAVRRWLPTLGTEEANLWTLLQPLRSAPHSRELVDPHMRYALRPRRLRPRTRLTITAAQRARARIHAHRVPKPWHRVLIQPQSENL